MDENFTTEVNPAPDKNNIPVPEDEKDKTIESLSGDVNRLNEELMKSWSERDAALIKVKQVMQVQNGIIDELVKIANIINAMGITK